MLEDVSVAQARILLASLHGHVEEISAAVAAIERRLGATTGRPVALSHQRERAAALRKDLYEAHRLIDALHLRFPATRDATNSVREHHPAAAYVGSSASPAI